METLHCGDADEEKMSLQQRMELGRRQSCVVCVFTTVHCNVDVYMPEM